MLTNYLPKVLDIPEAICVCVGKGAEDRKAIVVSCSCDPLH